MKRGIAVEPRTHHFSDARHFRWDNRLDPALTVESGDTVVFKCREAYDGQFTRESTVETLKTLDMNRIHSLSGPVAVSGAKPGDVLQVEILDLEHEGWAYTAVFPRFGLLPEDFGDNYAFRIWNVGRDARVGLKPGIRIPIEPFCGEMGVALKEPGAHSTMPPRRTGGNLDIRHLCKGSVLYLPVEVPDGLFSTGDGHLAQGDGEVCGLALEAPLTVTLRLTVLKGRSIPGVQFLTMASTTSKYDGMGYYATTGDGSDLHENAQNAVRRMIDHLEREYGLSRTDAYMLCSVAGDLKIGVPVLGEAHASIVTFHMPRSIFVDSQ